MKKLIILFMVAGFAGLMACGGPSAEEKAAAEKARMDSIAQVAAQEAEQALLDSLARVEEEAAQQAKLDSLEQALEAEKSKPSAPAKVQPKKEEPKPVQPQEEAKPTRSGATKRG